MLTYDFSLDMVNFAPALPHDRKRIGEFHYEYKRNQNVTELPLSLIDGIICINKYILLCRVSPTGGDWGGSIHPTTRKIGLSPDVPLPLFWPKIADFVIFMQFLTILPKLSPAPVDPIWETLLCGV